MLTLSWLLPWSIFMVEGRLEALLERELGDTIDYRLALDLLPLTLDGTIIKLEELPTFIYSSLRYSSSATLIIPGC
jgi:hypothetical protein